MIRNIFATSAIALSFAQIVTAKDCPAELSAGFNATGSSTTQLLGKDWTFTRYVDVQASPDGTSATVNNPITVKTDAIDLTKTDFTACMVFPFFPYSGPQTYPITDSGDCKGYLGQDCITAIVNSITSVNATSTSPDHYCDDLKQAIENASAACPKIGMLTATFPVLPLDPSASLSTCPIKGSDDKSGFLISNLPAMYDQVKNMTADVYDPSVGQPFPFFITTRTGQDDNSGFNDQNTAMTCIPAGKIAAGSRAPGAAMSGASASNGVSSTSPSVSSTSRAPTSSGAPAPSSSAGPSGKSAAGKVETSGVAIVGILGIVSFATVIGLWM